MDTRMRGLIIVPAMTLALGFALSGCTVDDGASQSPTPAPSSASTEPSPSPESDTEPFAYPDTTDPVQVAIYLKYEGNEPSGTIIAGPAVLVADRPFSIEAQCEGTGASFEVVTADGESRTLAEGDFDCAEPPSGEFTYQLPYAGPVQVNMFNTDGVDRAWVRVVQP